MDETQTVRELLEIMREHDLDAMKVKVGDQIFEFVRRNGQPAYHAAPSPVPAPGHAAASSPVASTQAPPANVKRVTAPLVGVFYSAPSPGAEPFVTPGDRVEVGQVLCILEAMKLFNEITSDYAGIVRRIIPENGELVSLGQELFWIEP